MSNGEILYTHHSGLCILKLVGDIRYTTGSLDGLSRSLDLLVEKLYSPGDIKRVIIDLTHTTAIDSTNLGVLARLGLESKSHHLPRPTVISNNDDVTRTLQSMGCDQVFDIVKESENDEEDFIALPTRESCPKEELKMVLDAHRRLMALSEENAAIFRDVVELLEQEFAPGTPEHDSLQH